MAANHERGGPECGYRFARTGNRSGARRNAARSRIPRVPFKVPRESSISTPGQETVSLRPIALFSIFFPFYQSFETSSPPTGWMAFQFSFARSLSLLLFFFLFLNLSTSRRGLRLINCKEERDYSTSVPFNSF